MTVAARTTAARFSSIRQALPGLIGLIFVGGLFSTGCAKQQPESPRYNESAAQLRAAIQQPLTPDESKELLGEVGGNWLYGQGLGEAALTVGTSVLFPPYALYVAGNAALTLSGYEEIRITDALPDRSRDTWNDIYDGVTSVPGRITAGVSGNEYRSREVAKERIEKFMAERKQNSESGKEPYGDSRADSQARY